MEKKKPTRSGVGSWLFVIILFNIYLYYIAIPSIPTTLNWSVPEAYLYMNLIGLSFNWLIDEVIYWYQTNR